MTRFLSSRSLRSRGFLSALMLAGITAATLVTPRAARADHDDWHWHHGHHAYYYGPPRPYVRWAAPVFVAPPPPYYAAVPAVPSYVVAPPPPVVVVPALPRIVLPIGHHGAVVFGP